MSQRKGGGTLPIQIKKLEQDMDSKQIEQAKTWAHSSPSIVRLAFKYLDKPHKQGLTNRQIATYEQIRSISPTNAEQWKADRLAETKVG